MNSFPRSELSKIIEKHSWKSILLSMIYEGKIDPWDIDIDLVIDEFTEKIKDMKKLDLYIPGNLILATSILLKYKSLYLFPQEEKVEEREDMLELETPQINIVKRLKPERPISVNELIKAIENAIKINFKAVVQRKSRQMEIVKLELPKFKEEDIDEKINKMFAMLVERMDEYGIVRFEELIKGRKKEENVSNFLVILHMENEEYIAMKQEEAFGEILIYVNKEKVIS